MNGGRRLYVPYLKEGAALAIEVDGRNLAR